MCCQLLSVRYVVCRDNLLSFLDFNDLLRLRRVSKPFKHEVEDFIRTKKVKTSRELDICFADDSPFEEYFEFEGTSSFFPQRESLFMRDYIHTRTNSYSTRRLLQSFLSTCGANNITTLIIDVIQGGSIPLHSKRWVQFFDSFPNLAHLQLRDVPPFPLDDEKDLFATRKELTIPIGLKKLKHLEMYPTSCPYGNVNPTARQISFAFCVKLVENYISNLERMYLPFEMFHLEWDVEWGEMMRFACMCLLNDHNVKLVEVHGDFIEELLEIADRIPEMGTTEVMGKMINSKVDSVYCPETMTFLQELPNLKKIEFEGAEKNCWMPDPGFVRQDWPKLEVLTVDFMEITDNDSVDDLDEVNEAPSLLTVWEFLFFGIIRTNVVDLKMRFHGFVEPNATFPRTPDILSSCPNLKILRLETKVRQLVGLPELWKGLQHLEELYFNLCSDVTDADFVGDDESSPVFWKLNRLKVLELSGIDEMKVTDKLFSKVLRHMPLKDLSVHSNFYTDSITLDGIESLLDGKFATTIEKLSLDLAGVMIGEQKRVKTLFRSSQMI